MAGVNSSGLKLVVRIPCGATPAKMLRVATPSPGNQPCEPRIRSPLRQQQENDLRRHIVGMVREQTGEINVDAMKAGESTIIYQIKKKGGIAPLKATPTTEDQRNDAMKRIHLKMMRATRAKGLRQFPALDSYADVINNENNEPTTANVNEPIKRIRTLHIPNEERRGSSAKSVRFKIEDKSTHVPVNNSASGYEVRGNAIRSGTFFSKSAPPSSRRTEVLQKQAQIHTSLQLFKRRLKLNQDSYLAPNSTIRESDYIIRRIPLKLEKNAKVPSISADGPIEPRLNLNNAPHRPKTPSGARPVTPASSRRKPAPAPAVRPVSSGSKSQEDNPERKIRFSYRLPENLNLGKEVSFVEESEPIPSVNTYVLEENKRKGGKKFETQATLSTHNLGVHDALTANDGSKIQVGEENEVDQRLVKWVEESNVNTQTRKMNRLRSTAEKDPTDHVNEAPRFLSEGDRSVTVA